jgi:cyclopropane fatty-acyl-phospholipid synthase-like methyltransferase
MKNQITAKKSTWESTWSKETNIIFDRIVLKNKETLELGAGTGRLSCLLLKNGAKRVTLLDYSKEGEKKSRRFFKKTDKANYKTIDLFKFKSSKKYDIVFSSGLIEHFQGKKFDQCLKKHFELSKNIVFLIVPASPHYNDIRVKTKKSLEKYGWQKPMTLKEMEKLVESNNSKIVINKRFLSFYGIRFLGSISLPKIIERVTGGLIISVYKKTK